MGTGDWVYGCDPVGRDSGGDFLISGGYVVAGKEDIHTCVIFCIFVFNSILSHVNMHLFAIGY